MKENIKAIEVRKIAIPSQDSALGAVYVKLVTVISDEGSKMLVGIGEEDWIIKHGIEITNFDKLIVR
jgi:hypothetical protein